MEAKERRRYCSTDAAEWLFVITEYLNPLRIPSHTVSVQELVKVSKLVDPPPTELLTQWTRCVWRLAGEPWTLYLSRCLSFHFGLTHLAPQLRPVKEEFFSANGVMPPVLHWPAWEDTPSTTVKFGIFRVAGLHTQNGTADYVPTGVEPQPCPNWCVCTVPGAAVLPRYFPAVLGGSSCEYCGTVLPTALAYTLRAYAVLEAVATASSSPSQRCSAVVLGEANVLNLILGRIVHVLYTVTKKTDHETLLTIHSAALSLYLPLSIPLTPNKDSHAAFSAAALREQQLEAGKQLTFSVACRQFAAGILGHQAAKKALLLCLLHTLYCRYRPVPTPASNPLHAALLGAAKAGKSSLLRAVGRLCAGRADYLAATAVRGRRGGRGGLEAVWPHQSGQVLLAGSALLYDVLLLDGGVTEWMKAPSLLPLTALLEDGVVEMTNASGEGLPGALPCSGIGGAAAFRSTAQVFIATAEDPVLLAPLLPGLRLLIPLESGLTLQQSVTIGDSVVSSMTRSGSRDSSLASAAAAAERSPAATREEGGPPFTAAAPRLSEEAIEYWVGQAGPEYAALEAALTSAGASEFFTSQLEQHAVLVQLAARRSDPCVGLPPSASLRGARAPHTSVEVHQTLPLQRHVETLLALATARLVLPESPGERTRVLTLAMAEEVWEVYERSLQTAAKADAARPPALPPSLGADVPGQKRGRPAKRKWCVQFIQGLLQGQGGRPEGVCPTETVALVYERMGGLALFGDTLEGLLQQLQEMGMLIRRPSGWKVLGMS